MSFVIDSSSSFDALGLKPALLHTLDSLGYEAPSPIQEAMIPRMLEGADVIGQAQTGTGKTAAFALPLISRYGDEKAAQPKVLVLTPTRELALQVTESFQQYGQNCPQLRVTSLCGGMDYRTQIKALNTGVQVVVGTPGRVVDHLKRGTLQLDQLGCAVLDEADEMLRMGFIDDVQWILEQASHKHQVALFSATMPAAIRKLAQRYLTDPVEITIANKTETVAAIRQRYLMVAQRDKLDVMQRVLETETFDAVMLFVRTRESTVDLADFLQRAGFSAAALNGDMPQAQRELVVEQLKKKRFDILVATDVVARGLDVPRISLVLNYDIPFDAETYVHRIGRTGRAGREGDAVLFVTPREKRLLSGIERLTRQKVEAMSIPTTDDINVARKRRFKQRITDVLAETTLTDFQQLVEEYHQETGVDYAAIAAALGRLSQGNQPLYAKERQIKERQMKERQQVISKKPAGGSPGRKSGGKSGPPDPGMERFRIEVGHSHGAKPSNIVGAIANEIRLDSSRIGRIGIHGDFSTVDLPADLPPAAMAHLKKVRVAGQMLQISRDNGAPKTTRPKRQRSRA